MTRQEYNRPLQETFIQTKQVCTELAVSPWQVVITPQDKTFDYRSDHLVTPGITINWGMYAARCNIAITHGFYDIGRFAADYRSCFGELPSHTLLRPVRAVKEGMLGYE